MTFLLRRRDNTKVEVKKHGADGPLRALAIAVRPSLGLHDAVFFMEKMVNIP